MDPGDLKREYGKDLTFWGGGCDTQRVLTFGTPDDVEKDVRKRIAQFAPGGGFVFNQIHNIQPQVPPENIVRMFETVLKYGGYPLRG
jgi:uroporphyrinogen decarboxylase